MGRQIVYYMELDSFQRLVKKALELGFKVVDMKSLKIYEDISAFEILKSHHIYFFLEEAGELIITKNGYIDSTSSPVIEAGFSFIDEARKEITTNRLWVSSGYWNNKSEYISRAKILDKKYTSLMTYIKKIAPYTEVSVKAQNPIYNGKKTNTKVYITPYLLQKVNSGDYDCI